MVKMTVVGAAVVATAAEGVVAAANAVEAVLANAAEAVQANAAEAVQANAAKAVVYTTVEAASVEGKIFVKPIALKWHVRTELKHTYIHTLLIACSYALAILKGKEI